MLVSQISVEGDRNLLQLRHRSSAKEASHRDISTSVSDPVQCTCSLQNYLHCLHVRETDSCDITAAEGWDEQPLVIKDTVETDMLTSDNCRRSQQKFPDHRSTNTDDALLRVGGNRCIEQCIIIKESQVDYSQLQIIREGNLN